MQLNRITLKGFGPFAREVSLDIDSLNGPLVAITGEIGAGKTTLLELGLAGAIFRNCPTRPSLANLAGDDRNAYLESIITNGRRYRIRQLVDGMSKKGESSVIDDASGEVLTTSGKLTEFDAWTASHFPSEDVFYASLFTPQAFGGFLNMKPSDRKSILNRVLGIEHYEDLAERARNRAKDVRILVENARARLAELATRPTVETAEYDAAMQKAFADECDAALQECRIALTAAREDAERTRAEITRLEGDARQRREINLRLTGLRSTLAELQLKLKNNRELLANEKEVKAAVARLDEVKDLLATRMADRERFSTEAANLDQSLHEAVRHSQNAESLASQARQRVARYEATLTVTDEVTKAVEALPALETALKSAEQNERIARELVDMLAGEKVDSLSDRVTVYRNDMITIRDGLKGTESSLLMSVARGSVEDHDRANEVAAEHPAKLTDARAALAEWTAAVKERRDAQTAAERLAGRSGEIENAAKELETAQRDVIEQDADARTFSANARNIQIDLEAKNLVLASCNAELRTLETEKAGLIQATKSADKLEGARARVTEYEAQQKTLEADIASAEKELTAIQAPTTMPTEPDIRTVEGQVTVAERAAREAGEQLAIAQAKVNEAKETAQRIENLTAELGIQETAFADWQRLAEDFGRDGLQALEIDAAGPELSETINDLLRTCIGPRWTVSIETTRASSDKKRQIEGCEVEITDNESPNGKPRPGDSFSGGERVLIGEAISDAFSIFMLRRAGITAPTLVRDESGAALSPGYVAKWMSMMRRVAEIVGASKVLFVSHNPEAHELADSVVRISNGSIAVVR